MGETELAAAILAGLSAPCAQTEYVRWHLTGDRAALEKAAGLEAGVAYPLREIEHRALSEAVKAHPEDANALNLLACLEYHMENHEKAEELWSRAAKADPAAYMPRGARPRDSEVNHLRGKDKRTHDAHNGHLFGVYELILAAFIYAQRRGAHACRYHHTAHCGRNARI